MTDLFALPAVRLAVVGLGLMGERHCHVIRALPEAELVGVYDIHADRAARVSIHFGVDVFTTYEALLDSEDVDGVVICLPSSLHADFGIRAARAGKHVITEKPIDSSLEKARRLQSLCQQAGVCCAVINQNRYSAGLAALHKAVTIGLMGTPVLARATVKWFRHDEYYTESSWRGRRDGENGGVLINQAVHSIDTLQWLFGVPDQVVGFTHCSRPGVVEMEDTAVAILKWNSGLVATLEACTCAAPGFDEGYEVHSPVATMKVEKGRVDYWYHRDGLPLPQIHFDEAPDLPDPRLLLFYRQYDEIIRAIQQDDPAPDANCQQAVAVVETIEKIYNSAR